MGFFLEGRLLAMDFSEVQSPGFRQASGDRFLNHSLFEYLAPQEAFHYGGSIVVESKTEAEDPDGRGTTFVITFPVHHAGKSIPPE